MVFFDTKQLRVYTRLWIFCLVFGILSMTFCLLYGFERKNAEVYRQNDEMLAYAGLCEYLSQCRELFSDMESASPARLVMLSRQFASLSGGARATAVSLPTGKAQRERIADYFTSADEYLSNLTARMLTGELPNENDARAISALNLYAAETVGRLERFADKDCDTIIKELSVLAIDTPPQIYKIEGDGSESEQVSFKASARKSALLAVKNGQAKDTARRYLGRYVNLRRAELGGNIIRFYSGSSFIDILRYGGNVLRISVGREISRLNLDGGEARQKSDAHLAALNLSHAKIVSEKITAGRMDFRYYLDGAYIIVGVALDNGKIVRYDASQYFNLP